MAQTITFAGEQLFASQAQLNQRLDIDTFIFALIPNQDPNTPIDRNEQLPPSEQIVHTQAVEQTGKINENTVVYSTVLSSLTGPFEFNWVGLYSSVHEKVILIQHIPTVSKTIAQEGMAGNTLNRNLAIEFSGIAEITGITVAPQTWQIDFSARLNGIDRQQQKLASDMNGDSWFDADNMKVYANSNDDNKFFIRWGFGYVKGLRVEQATNHLITATSYPMNVYVDAWLDGDSSSVWSPKHSFILTDDDRNDYVDQNGKQHYVTKIAILQSSDVVEDKRGVSGIKNKLDKHLSNETSEHDDIYAHCFNTKVELENATLPAGIKVKTHGWLEIGDGGEAEYFIEQGTDGVNGLTVLQVGENKAVRDSNCKKASCGFIFDDQYLSVKDVLVPLFNNHQAKLGVAAYTISIGGSGRLTANDILDLSEKGHEIINHSYSHKVMDNSVSAQFVKAEVNTSWAWFEKMGIHVNAWLTPNSVLGTQHYDLVKSNYPLAWTVGNSAEPMRNVDPHKMWRLGVESFSTEQCKEALEKAIIFGGSVILYAHDVPSGGTIYNRIKDLLTYANDIGLPVLSPTASVKHGISGYTGASRKFISGKLIHNRRNPSFWTATNGANIVIDSNNDLIVSSTAAGQSVIQTVVEINLEDLGALTFSSAIRKLGTALDTNNSIGLKISNQANTEVLYQKEEFIGELGTNYRRYSLTGQSFNDKVRILLYFRVDFSAADQQLLIRDPLLRYGNDVLALENRKENSTGYDVVIANQTVQESEYTVTNNLELADMVDNGLFKVEEDKIIFTKATRVAISISVMAHGENVLAGSQGGMLFLKYGEDTLQAPLSAGAKTGGGSINTVLDVDTRRNLNFSLFNGGCDFPVFSQYSRVVIRELD